MRDVAQTLGNEEFKLGAFIVLSKAFNTVDH